MRVDPDTGVRWYLDSDLGFDMWGDKYRARTMNGLNDTGNRCVLCGRKTADTAKTMGIVVIGGGGALVHVEDAATEEANDPGGWMGWFPVGNECIKVVPAEFRAANPWPRVTA